MTLGTKKPPLGCTEGAPGYQWPARLRLKLQHTVTMCDLCTCSKRVERLSEVVATRECGDSTVDNAAALNMVVANIVRVPVGALARSSAMMAGDSIGSASEAGDLAQCTVCAKHGVWSSAMVAGDSTGSAYGAGDLGALARSSALVRWQVTLQAQLVELVT